MDAPATERELQKRQREALDVDVLARTIYGEARGERIPGKEAIASVVLNRVKRAIERGGRYWWGTSIAEVCQKAWQFSCWNLSDPNREKILAVTEAHPVFATCLRIARRAVGGELDDATKGATHYHTKAVHPPWAWRQKPCAEIGSHLFYNAVE
ncbi:MAG: hydrolase [Alphaproteobacteria bacterium RIFOXYD12_FULL_60_8]|nr:MAG: hydrolase [Alphaproteobacteria bacterium RIFOXYD12_FULL_60_8]